MTTEVEQPVSPVSGSRPPGHPVRDLGRRVLDARAAPIISTIGVVIVLLWAGSLFFEPFVFPPLTRTLQGVVFVLSQQWPDLLLTLARFAVALAAAILVGWGLGLLMGAYRRTIGRFANPVVALVQAVPALSWILLAVLWMQSVELRIWFVTFMIAFPFFAIAVYEGIRDMDKDVLEAIEQFRPKRSQVLRILLIPQSVVNVIMTFRATAAMTLKLMVFAELIGANNGIGFRLSLAQSNFRVDYILAWTVVLVLANFLLVGITNFVESKALNWRAEAVVR